MDSIVEEEFRRIRDNIGKSVEVSMEEFLDPPCFGPETYVGRLDDVKDYAWVKIFVGDFGIEHVQRQIPFIGSGSGIALIKDDQGNVLYKNEGLIFNKAWVDYNPFFDPADNEEINRMRMAKFGEGHDFKLLG